MVSELEEVFTPKEVAKALKLSEKTVLQYLREGRLPGFRVGKHWRVRHAALAALVQPEVRPVLVAEPVTPTDDGARHDTADAMHPQQRKAALKTRCHAMRATGMTYQAIMNVLNGEGVPTLSGRGHWTKGAIANLLAER